jgi:hypothetical protein
MIDKSKNSIHVSKTFFTKREKLAQMYYINAYLKINYKIQC